MNNQPTIDPSALTQRAMLVSLNIKIPSNSKQDKDSTAEVTAEHQASDGAARVNKSLFSKEVVKEYTSPASEARKIVSEMSLPWSQKGTRILLAENYFNLLKKIEVQEKAFWAAAEKFKGRLEDNINESRTTLGTLFRDDDYPGSEELEAMFSFELSFMPMPDENDFRVSLGAEEEQRMKERLRQQVESTVRAAAVEPYQRVKDAIGALVARLEERAKQEEAGPKTGKRMTPIKGALLNNLSDLAESISGLNILQDPKLDEIGKGIEKMLTGVEPDDLKGSPHLQRDLAGKAQALSEKVDQYSGLI